MRKRLKQLFCRHSWYWNHNDRYNTMSVWICTNCDSAEIRATASPVSLQEPLEQKPFLFAIEDDCGNWHDGEQCVFSDRASADDEVEMLNENITSEESRYKVVPLFRAAVSQQAGAPEETRLNLSSFGNGDYSCSVCGMGAMEPCEHWKKMLASNSGKEETNP